MMKGLRRYEFSERLAEILGGSRRDLRYRVTLMVSGGLVAPGPRGPGSPPATPQYAADLLIGAMAAPQQAHTIEAIRCYRDLLPAVMASNTVVPAVALGPPSAGSGIDAPLALPLFSHQTRFGDALARLLDQARAEETRGTLGRELFGIWISRGFPVAAVQLGAWLEGRRIVITQHYQLAEGARPPPWLDPEQGGIADPGLIHNVFLPVSKVIEIGTLTTLPNERKTQMIDIGLTLSNLANLVQNQRLRRSWEKLLSAYTTAQAWTDKVGTQGSRLAEMTGFGSNPGNLRMFTYVPDQLPASAPLVVVLHGCTQSANSYDQGSGWSTLADRYGFALLLPQQNFGNNPLRCFNWFRAEDTDRESGESHSINQMIERMIADRGIDRGSVYVTGVSSGGAMTSVMLSTYPDVFAGGAIIAGLPYRAASGMQDAFECIFQGRVRSEQEWGNLVRAASAHQGPWPKISVWHGADDAAVKPMNAAETIKQWTNVHGLVATPSIETSVDGHSRHIWHNADGEELIESYTIAGMGHGVPLHPGDQEHQCGTAAPFFNDAGISSTHQIARFWGLLERQPAAHTRQPSYSMPRAEVSDVRASASPGQLSAILVDSAGHARAAENAGPEKPDHDQRAGQSGGATRGAGVRSFVSKSLEAAEFLKGLRGLASDGARSQPGVDVQKIVSKSLEAAGILKGLGDDGGAGARSKAGAGLGLDVSSIIAKSLEVAGVLKGQQDTPPESRENSAQIPGSSWEGDGWQLLTGDPSSLGDRALLYGCAASGTEGVVGNKLQTVSRQLSLGDGPTLSYFRKLDIRAAANDYTTASFSVRVDGVVVDEVVAVGMDHTETEWVERTSIDLARFSGRTVTLTFEVAANSNVCIEVFAKAWLDRVSVQETATVAAL